MGTRTAQARDLHGRLALARPRRSQRAPANVYDVAPDCVSAVPGSGRSTCTVQKTTAGSTTSGVQIFTRRSTVRHSVGRGGGVFVSSASTFSGSSGGTGCSLVRSRSASPPVPTAMATVAAPAGSSGVDGSSGVRHERRPVTDIQADGPGRPVTCRHTRRQALRRTAQPADEGGTPTGSRI
ncbi:hypothetical protein [Kitasatospora sp. GP82]|uniref:hypothetical protein n=1 Tax=Kitasatospora sp. GP82 TaxID=3035089 RepID=UPI0024744BA5|nr:hypothetical protein [Kitasatospora sp. GP82]MDH6124818.1 hypothetical protein [Kitasatospora sp. GP82]